MSTIFAFVLPSPRLRTVSLAAVFSFTIFFIGLAPTDVPVPRPEALQPQTASALGCADEPLFTGHLTSSTGSTALLTKSTTGNVFGYISNVVDNWSCTAYYRYDGLAWMRPGGLMNFDWGNLIRNITNVPCNWVVGETNYVKANASTTDCHDTDAEYAMPIRLSAWSDESLWEAVFSADAGPDVPGEFTFAHSDCTSYYAGSTTPGERMRWGVAFASTEVLNRPGDNCDPRVLDGQETNQTLVVDATNPVVGFDWPDEGTGPTIVTSATAGVTFDATDNVAGFGGIYVWSLQRQKAPITGFESCGTWASDGSSITGTANALNQVSAQGPLADGCYRWTLSAEDQNGNGPVSTTSGSVIIDETYPAIDFSAPDEATTTTQSTTDYAVEWIEIEAGTGIDSRLLQRQRVAATSAACSGTFVNDGAAESTESPSDQTLTPGYCYQWSQTIVDGADNDSTKVSGKVYFEPASPTLDFTAPISGDTTLQTSTSATVTWTEDPPDGYTITSRSLQRQVGSIVEPSTCDGVSWANDGTAVTSVSPVSATDLLGGNCYRWTQTLINSSGKTGSATSGSILVDPVAPVGNIATPIANAPVSGDVTITGSATDASSFGEYQVEYGAGATPTSWTLLEEASTSQVQPTGTLGVWTPGSLSGVYTIRLTVRDNAGNADSVTTRTVILENAGRGEETYLTRTPFDLGGDWRLDVGVHNGEARLSRDLFSIPSYGPAQALSLSYSSLESSAAGRFGTGWNSNLTQHLTFDATDIVVWHRADGGRVPFGKVAGVWTALAGHYETLALSGTEYIVTQKDQTKLVFESSGAGRLKRIENRFGKALILAWNTSSATATDASGRVTNLVIDSANDRITSVTDSAGRAWSFGYTGTALTTVTDPASKVTTLGYAGALLTSVSRSRSRVAGAPEAVTWTVGYTDSKATAVSDPVAATTANTFTYNETSTDVGLLRETSPSVLRDTWTYDLDSLGRVTDATDPLGFITSTTYDANSNATAIANPIGTGTAQSTTTYTYDSRGNVLTETMPIDGSTSVTTVSTYNATNDLLTRTDADNDSATRTVTRYGYDGSGHLTSVNVNCTTTGTTPPASGAGGSCTGAGTQDASTNLITSYAYTANDQLAFEQDPLGRVTKYGYDAWGNQTSVTANCTSSGVTQPSPFDSCTGSGTADAQTNVTSTTTYLQSMTAGKAGLPTTITDALSRDTTFTYDTLGRQLTEVLPGDASIPALTRTTTYDELGNVLTETEAWTGASRTTSHVYDLANRETTTTDPAGLASTTTYDYAGNPVGATAGGVTTTRTFDGLRRTLSETNPAGTAEHGYDAAGNEIQTLSAEGDETTRTFTQTGWLLTATTDPTGQALVTVHAYDRLGRELTVTEPYPAVGSPTSTTTRTYDRVGRQITSQVTGGPLLTTTQDRAGNGVAVLGADGKMSASLVDPLDRVVISITNCTDSGTTVPAAGAACTGAGTANATTNVTTRTYYDKTGTVIATKDAKGITVRTIANLRGLAKETIANCTDSGTTPTSNPSACTGAGTANATTNVQTTTSFDGSGAALSTVTAVGTGAAATTYTAYDAAGRVRAVKDPMGTISRHFYHATTGQLTKTVVNCTTTGTTIPTDWTDCTGAGTADGTWNLTTTYGYDGSGNQTSVVAPNGRETRIGYDADRRVVTRTENYVDGIAGSTDDLVTIYYYDAAGRQSAAKAPTANGTTFAVTRYLYDANGRLWKEIRNCVDASSGTAPDACDGDLASPAADQNITTEYLYDSKGKRIRLIVPDPSATSGTATGTITTQYAFDAADRLCRVVENATGSTDLQTLTDPCSTTTQTAGTATSNVSTRYTFDPAGNLATMVDARGNTTTYGYDAAGRMTTQTDALGGTLVWVYDALGNRLRQENRADPPMTASVQWTYDGAARVLTRTADGVTTTYTYDDNGNKLSASDGTLTITSSYDRLNRVLAVDDEDAGSTADTTYAYSLSSPSWTDPTGSYAATLDKFDRATAVNDPVNASDFTWTYRADGQAASFGQPNGNTTAFAYDALGRVTSKDTTAGGTNRALYDWTRNRAGQILSEDSQVTGDGSNGTVTYAYDQLARLTGSTLSGTTTAYGWDKVPNRTSVQVGAGTAASTTFDATNRPTAGANPSATYTNDDDGRLTARPGQTFEWDHLGRLTKVKDGAGTTTIATYTYDPLDRLRLADHGGSNRTRFRYVGLTTSVAQWLDDQAGTVTRSVANGWTGERLADWTGSGSDLRIYGANGHHDTTWLASSTGTVSGALRYDPWGTPRSTAPTGYSPFRFQGSLYDETTEISWVVTRWYAPALGRFISEDSLLGEPIDPPSRHLFAYSAGEPIGRWDPDGRLAYSALEYRSFPNRARFKGRLEIGLFIAVRYTEFLGNRTYGDDRGYSPGHVRCRDSRACLIVDFDKKLVTARVNATCTDHGGFGIYVGYGCNSAFDVKQFGQCGGILNDRCNLLSVRESWQNILTIRWDFTQSRLPIIRPDMTVNGSVSISPRTATKGARVDYIGEGFPSEEAYYFHPAPSVQRTTLFQHREGGFQLMADWLGDWRTVKYLPPSAGG